MEKIKEINTDYLIVGSGIAGLFTALNLSRLGKVIVITKKFMKVIPAWPRRYSSCFCRGILGVTF